MAGPWLIVLAWLWAMPRLSTGYLDDGQALCGWPGHWHGSVHGRPGCHSASWINSSATDAVQPCKSALLVKDPVTSVMSIVTLNQTTAPSEFLCIVSYSSHTTVSYAFSSVSLTNLLIRRLIRPSHTYEIGSLLIRRARYV